MELKRVSSSENQLSSYSICTTSEKDFNDKSKYEIEIEHPYLNSCLLRADYNQQSLSFYEQLKLIESL